MEHLIMYWALVVAPADLGRVDTVFRTNEPCRVQAEQYRRMGYKADCVPTNQLEISRSEQQLRSLANLLYGNTDRTSSH